MTLSFEIHWRPQRRQYASGNVGPWSSRAKPNSLNTPHELIAIDLLTITEPEVGHLSSWKTSTISWPSRLTCDGASR
jgi:hypothetical protein